ncbi:dihydrofolate reductase family protein [Gordonia hydrophobica]|uniref:Dihydrofolate reductase family protein n=1 Tax=Gordonia hydrophobica TaxID=40516 RepID=A0ABZ2TXJ0_9ACTN|nr:dihydrofolate reductase family protein [Gordonia hydrophobica]MBM7366389.1 dihydrofolate reductase [Gordonia hydrophobica]
MGTLSYTTAVSLDGYIADANGDFQWAAPSAEIFRVHVDRMNAVSAEILGRRTYELMRYWESEPDDESWTADEREFAQRWSALDRIVASSTMASDDVGSPSVRLVPVLTLSAIEDVVRAAPGEVEIFGPTTASAAIRAGLVTDIRFFVVPVVIGGGLRALPDDARLNLRLQETRPFANGTVYLHYRTEATGRP